MNKRWVPSATLIVIGIAAVGVVVGISHYGRAAISGTELLAAVLNSSESRVSFYEGFDATTYLIRKGDKPVPVQGDSDCASGPIACKMVFQLRDVPPPPPPPQNPNQPTEITEETAAVSSTQKIVEKSFSVTTTSGKTFSVLARLRQTGQNFGATLECTSPDGKTSMSSSVAEGSVQDWRFLTIACPKYSLDATHYIEARFNLSSEKGNGFWNVL